MLASSLCNNEVVKMLLSRPANSSKEDWMGHTALCYAMSSAIEEQNRWTCNLVEILLNDMYKNGITLKDYLKVSSTRDVMYSLLNSKFFYAL